MNQGSLVHPKKISCRGLAVARKLGFGQQHIKSSCMMTQVHRRSLNKLRDLRSRYLQSAAKLRSQQDIRGSSSPEGLWISPYV
jgi:hypothetical protein